MISRFEGFGGFWGLEFEDFGWFGHQEGFGDFDGVGVKGWCRHSKRREEIVILEQIKEKRGIVVVGATWFRTIIELYTSKSLPVDSPLSLDSPLSH